LTPAERSAVPVVDLTLLRGFRFACRPGCGLCCYATPAVSPSEERGLLAIEPSVEFLEGAGGFRLIPARPDGGGCQFLQRERCTVHAARPFPCREYPLSVHLSDRWQATVVLGCPGVETGELARWLGRATPGDPPVGLDAELAAVESELAAGDATGLDGTVRRWSRALRTAGIEGAADGVERLRRQVSELRPFPTDDDLRSLDLPRASEGRERLPMFFDARLGRVALAGTDEGVELHQLREAGGTEQVLARLAPLDRIPRLLPDARATLDGYLAYLLRRDAFLGSILEEGRPGPLADRMVGSLRAAGATVLARAVWRAQLGGGGGATLDEAQLWDGIRATDADLLDRPTVGAFL
jgi:hypothetical protein